MPEKLFIYAVFYPSLPIITLFCVLEYLYIFWYNFFMQGNYLRKALENLNPAWPLRLGLGLMYLYSGFDLFYHPEYWEGFLPAWMERGLLQITSVDAYLRMQGLGEFIIGLLFLVWFSGKWGVRAASILAALEMALILLLVGVDRITFRDIGLLGAALAILIIYFRADTPLVIKR